MPWRAHTAHLLFAMALLAGALSPPAAFGVEAPLPPVCPGNPLHGAHRTYDVGPGQRFHELTDVPFLSLQAGDVVNIYYRADPYRTMIALRAQGTAAKPVVINGVPDEHCALPQISGEDAVYATDRVSSGYNNQYTTNGSVVYIYRAYADKPRFITLQNLKITGGKTGIYAVTVEDLLVQGCDISDNFGWGVFVNTKNDDPHGEETSYRVTIRDNRLTGNGVVGSYLFHNLYIQAARALYEGNYIGQLRPGAIGSSLKDRSSGTIIRYNTIIAAARALDLVETEGGHGSLDADPLYNDAWVYGNLIINDESLPGQASASLIHWGYDNTAARARTGTLHFFSNTVVSRIARDPVALFDQQSNNDATDPHNVVELMNNVIWHAGGELSLGRSQGAIRWLGKNWISRGWVKGLPAAGTQVTVGGDGTLIEGTDPQLDADYRPRSASALVGQARGTPPMPVEKEFQAPMGVKPRPTAADLGAREH